MYFYFLTLSSWLGDVSLILYKVGLSRGACWSASGPYTVNSATPSHLHYLWTLLPPARQPLNFAGALPSQELLVSLVSHFQETCLFNSLPKWLFSCCSTAAILSGQPGPHSPLPMNLLLSMSTAVTWPSGPAYLIYVEWMNERIVFLAWFPWLGTICDASDHSLLVSLNAWLLNVPFPQLDKMMKIKLISIGCLLCDKCCSLGILAMLTFLLCTQTIWCIFKSHL